jgi:hypothetical protein
VDITADVDDSPTPERKQLLDKVRIAPFARWVDDERCVLTGKVADDREYVGSVPSAERAFSLREVVKTGIVCRKLDGVSRELDSGNCSKVWREHDGEETASTVSVYEVSRSLELRGCGEDGVSDVVGEWDKDRVIVLEEGVSGEFEVFVADFFSYGGFVVCDAYVFLQLGRQHVYGGGISIDASRWIQ